MAKPGRAKTLDEEKRQRACDLVAPGWAWKRADWPLGMSLSPMRQLPGCYVYRANSTCSQIRLDGSGFWAVRGRFGAETYEQIVAKDVEFSPKTQVIHSSMRFAHALRKITPMT